MALIFLNILIALAFVNIGLTFIPPPYVYQTKYFKTLPVDHFSFSDDNVTFDMRYLINDTFWDRNGGPIFFYCGNEGAIEMFAANTGFMWDIAPEFKAMVIFAEHRYYGQTLPYGNKSYQMPYLGKLSSEQAQADFAVFLTWLKSNTPGAQDSPVISFGGSYGGMLAAWMRMKYPHIITGAIASSAPILQFSDLTPCWTSAAIVTQAFRDCMPGCDKAVNRSWSALREKSKTAEGRLWINEHFHLCNDSKITKEDNISRLIDWMQYAWFNLAMINYPYSNDFLEPVPAWPVTEACKLMMNSSHEDNDTFLIGIHQGISVYFNHSGQRKCFSFHQASPGDLGDEGWNFQACTEMVMPACSNGSDMFEPDSWNMTAYDQWCHAEFGVKARPNWAITNYGLKSLRFTSNIVLSNGLLDPWFAGGVLESISDTIIAIVIKDAAHHYDLRGEHPNDTAYVREARHQEVGHMKKWIERHNAAIKGQRFWDLRDQNQSFGHDKDLWFILTIIFAALVCVLLLFLLCIGGCYLKSKARSRRTADSIQMQSHR